jgi:prevent-host-death family protein
MRTLRATEAKTHLLRILEDVSKTHECYQIIRNGIPEAVLLSTQEYEEILETLDILSDAELMRHLRVSRDQARKGRVRSHREVFGEPL